MAFTFKTHNPTGRYRSFDIPYHEIKLKRKVCGQITDQKSFNKKHKVRLHVIKKDINEDGNPNCKWKWIEFKTEFKVLQDAKDWLNKHFDAIIKTYNIYCQED